MRQERSHKYILISGLVAALFYVLLMYAWIGERDFIQLFVSFIIFYAVWVGIQYLLFRRKPNDK